MSDSYAGIGSRKTPDDMLSLMDLAAAKLALNGLTLRSGGAVGADSAFEAGARRAGGPCEIFLPWRDYNNRPHKPGDQYEISTEALRIAENYHPAWHRCSPGVRKMMARNVYQILGSTLDDPVLFVLCWTPGGKAGGGTGQAIRLAQDCGSPVFDLGGSSLDEIAAGISALLAAKVKTEA